MKGFTSYVLRVGGLIIILMDVPTNPNLLVALKAVEAILEEL
jgi:hypothetical protein